MTTPEPDWAECRAAELLLRTDDDLSVLVGGLARHIVHLRQEGRFNRVNVIRALEGFYSDLADYHQSAVAEALRAARREALEEAAGIADKYPTVAMNGPNVDETAECIAVAIRAKKDQIK